MLDPLLLAEATDGISAKDLGTWVICVFMLVQLSVGIKKLFFEKELPANASRSELATLSTDVETLSAKVDHCAKREELMELKRDLTRQVEKLERNTREVCHEQRKSSHELNMTVQRLSVLVSQLESERDHRVSNRKQ